MRFQWKTDGETREVVIRTRQLGSDWLASAVLLPTSSKMPVEFLRTGSSGTAIQLRAPTEQEAIEKMALILINAHHCTRI